MALPAPALTRIALLLAVACLPVAGAAPALLGNGTVALGVQDDGALGVHRPPGPDGGPVGDPVAGATVARNCGSTRTALRFLPPDDEATWCGRDGEGWGLAAGGVSGWAFGGQQGGSLAAASGTPSGGSYRSVARVGPVEVAHAFAPSSSPHLYRIAVELRNTGPATIPEVLYRRVVHWGAPGAASDLTVTDLVERPGSGLGDALWRSSLEPGPADPAAPWSPDSSMEGPPRQPDRTGMAALAQGTTWDLRFHNLHPGEARMFLLHYGAAPDHATAVAALGAVAAQAYALAMAPAADGSADRDGITFVSAVGSVPDARSAINDPPVAPSPPCIGVPPGQPMRLRLPEATDLEGGHLEYTVGRLPQGMVYWPGNRTLAWVPEESELGLSRGVAYTVTEYLLEDGTSVRPGTPGIVREQSATGEVCLIVQHAATDRDRDGVGDLQDNCPGEPNQGQEDADGDGIGDPCETQAAQGNATAGPPSRTQAPPPDRDGDGVRDALDRCPDDHDPEQEDADRDGLGDACDADQDGDTVPERALHAGDYVDNCPGTWNPAQRDRDGDGLGDSCDPDDCHREPGGCGTGPAATSAPRTRDAPREASGPAVAALLLGLGLAARRARQARR